MNDVCTFAQLLRGKKGKGKEMARLLFSRTSTSTSTSTSTYYMMGGKLRELNWSSYLYVRTSTGMCSFNISYVLYRDGYATDFKTVTDHLICQCHFFCLVGYFSSQRNPVIALMSRLGHFLIFFFFSWLNSCR